MKGKSKQRENPSEKDCDDEGTKEVPTARRYRDWSGFEDLMGFEGDERAMIWSLFLRDEC